MVKLLVWMLPGLLSAATVFDGSDDYITFARSKSFTGSNYTVAAWIYITSQGVGASSGTGGRIGMPIVCQGVGEGDGSNVDAKFFFAVQTNAGQRYLVGDYEDWRSSNNNNPVTGATSLKSNLWYHVALRHSESEGTLQVWLNGAVDGTLTTNTSPRADSTQHMGIGRALNSSGSATGAFAGRICEVAIWDTALATADLQHLANSRLKGLPRQIQPGNLKLYVPLDDFKDGVTQTGAFIVDRRDTLVYGTNFNSPVAVGDTLLTSP